MTKSEILTRLTALSASHESVLANVRSRNLAGQASSDPSRPTFLGTTLSRSDWETVARIERTAATVDALFAAARRELSFEGDLLASAVAVHQATPQRITEGMASLNSDIAAITTALLAKSVVFEWSSLPAR